MAETATRHAPYANVLVFGASGVIGERICHRFQRDNIKTYGVSRSLNLSHSELSVSLVWSLEKKFNADDFVGLNKFDAVVWAQGANCNDTIKNFERNLHQEIYEANVVFILESLRQLMDLGLIAYGARLCVVSSIWQEIARQNKLSYTVTKSALRGLVQSLSIDLGPDNILVNAVLPGALDTPMTRANLTSTQIHKLENETPLRSLPQFEDVCELVVFLCSDRNTGITGQFIAADRGYSFVRYL